jgi:iron complex outermembrane recepter protein
MSSKHLRSILAISAVAIASSAAFGQEASQEAKGVEDSTAATLEEVVVTARKREESLLNIPLAVTVLGSKEIQEAQIFDLREITKLAPGAYIQTVAGNGAGRYIPSLIFRGMTAASSLPRIQTGAVFVDGSYVLGGVNAVNTVDVQRVEVLKGPQNAHFGRNTFGGAINFITRNPGNELGGEVNALASGRGSFDVNASIEGPLFGESLSGRLSVLTHKKAGQYTARDGGELGEEKTKSFSGTLYYKPVENAWMRFRAYYQEDDDAHGPLAHLSGPLHGGNSCAGRTFSGFDPVTRAPRTYSLSIPYICGSIPTVSQVGAGIISVNTNLLSPRLATLGNPNGLINTMVNNSFNDPLIARVPSLDHFGLVREISRFSAQGEYTFSNGISIAFNAGYDDTRTMAIFDGDRSNEENVYGAMPALSITKNYELRLQSNPEKRWRWMVGANKYDGEFQSSYGGGGSVVYQVRTSPLATVATTPVRTATPAGSISTNGELAKVSAYFGSLEFDITDKLSIEGEVRYQKDEGRLTSAPTIAAAFSDVLPRAIVSYKPNEEWTLYASAARGVLPGTFNAQYATASAFHRGLIEAAFPGVTNVADSDQLDSYEIGSKQQLFGGRFQYTLAAYFMKWHNLKASSAFVVPTAPNATTTLTFTGIIIPGDAELKGIEWESTAILTDKWDFNLKANWQSGKYTNFVNPFLAQLTANVTRFDGNHLARVPDISASLASTYRGRINSDWQWFVRGDLTYTGKGWDSEANIVQNDPYSRVNARIGAEKNNLTVELYATNLFDNRDWDYIFRNVYQGSAGAIFQSLPTGFGFPAFGFPQGIVVGVPDRRDFGLRVKYKF